VPRWKYRAGLVKGDPDEPKNIQWICDNCHADKSHDDIGDAARHHQTGKRYSQKHRDAVSRGSKGKKLSAEHRAAISRSLMEKKRKPFSKQHRRNLSLAHMKPLTKRNVGISSTNVRASE
jgi:hypothetical protein